jgi:hypothetical protein
MQLNEIRCNGVDRLIWPNTVKTLWFHKRREMSISAKGYVGYTQTSALPWDVSDSYGGKYEGTAFWDIVPLK